MARINNLTNFLTDVATAIKAKLDDDTSIPASEFDSKIMNIETGGTYQEKSITISSNGSMNVVPDTGYDAMTKVAITTNIPMQQKAIQTVDTNGTVNITPDNGYTAMTSVNVPVNVPMENTSDYNTCLQLARAIVGETTLISDPYVSYNVTLDITNSDDISASWSSRNLTITTSGGE